MKEFKLIPLAPMTIAGPDIEELKNEAWKYVSELRKDGKKVTYTILYAVMVIPVEVDSVEKKMGCIRKNETKTFK